MRYGTYRFRTFSEIFTEKAVFLELWNEAEYPKLLPEAENEYGADITTLYYMLLARYANSPIAYLDETQFVNDLFSIVFQYGPGWAKKLEVQSKLRALTDADLIKGGKAFYNHALNPSTAPVNDSTEALPKIDSQNVTSYVKTAMEGYSNLVALLDDDVTREFLDRFERLFNPWVMPEYSVCYCEEDE